MQRVSTLFNTLRGFGSRRGHIQHTLVRDVMAQLPKDAILQIQEKHSGVIAKGEHHRKWLDIESHMQRAARDATTLGLHQCEPSRILDIGCGAGYFLAVAKHLGHKVTGLDMSDNEVFNDFVALMAIPRVVHCITPFSPLPDLLRQYNLITGFEVRFNWKNKRERWAFDEWRYFINDCRSRLAPGGRMRLQLNPGKDASYKFLPEETAGRLRAVEGITIPVNKSTLTVAA